MTYNYEIKVNSYAQKVFKGFKDVGSRSTIQ